ncbi:RelA/SpoT family protein [Acidobacteriota bacterium]
MARKKTRSAASSKGMETRIEDILEKIEPAATEEGLEVIRRAYLFAAKAHAGQKRLDGGPFITHLVETASILADIHMDPKTIIVGLLHDTLEDTKTTPKTLEQTFGRDVLHLVEGVTKIGRIQFHSDEEQQAENFRKLLMAMVDDPRVIMVKLADRLHNMRTLEYHRKVEKVRRIALETMEIYAPIAHRLGMGKIRGELEDLSFRHLNAEEYNSLKGRIDEQRAVGTEYISGAEQKMKESLEAQGIEATILGRIKRLYSIYQKLKRQGITVSEVYDYIAFRIITGSIKDCYAALGEVHNLWRPVPGRFKDFIAMPKPNLYQSLHTTIIGPQGHPFEIQIRTTEMHRIAEEGVAAHWLYKENTPAKTEEMKGFAWLRQFLEYHREITDPREFLNWVKLDLYPDDVYTFTPTGEVKAFPRGATPIDFAYAIHTEVGHQCVGAKINGKLVSLRTPLKNGDRIEILTVQDHTPSRDWLKYVKTARARQKITQWLNQEQKKRSIELGRRLLERETRRLKKTLKDIQEGEEALDKALQELGLGKLDDVYSAIGYGRVGPRLFLSKVFRDELSGPDQEKDEQSPEVLARRPHKGETEAIKVKGFGDMLVSRARCCNPVRGEEIIGYITRGRGVSVHTRSCPNVLRLVMDPERRIDVEWAGKDRELYRVKLSILMADIPGILAKLSNRIASTNTNIKHIGSRNLAPDKVILDFVLEIRDVKHLNDLTKSINQVPGVLEVKKT